MNTHMKMLRDVYCDTGNKVMTISHTKWWQYPTQSDDNIPHLEKVSLIQKGIIKLQFF
jgi:hypothetical protein